MVVVVAVKVTTTAKTDKIEPQEKIMQNLDATRHLLVIPFTKYRELLKDKKDLIRHLLNAGFQRDATTTLKIKDDDVIFGQTIYTLKAGMTVSPDLDKVLESLEPCEDDDGYDAEYQKEDWNKDDENY